jgi:hypothetical protein
MSRDLNYRLHFSQPSGRNFSAMAPVKPCNLELASSVEEALRCEGRRSPNILKHPETMIPSSIQQE